MSSEQPATPDFIPQPAYEATPFGNQDQIDFHASNLVPIEVIRARQAIAAAVATAPLSGSLEHNKIQVTAEKIAPQKAIANVTLHIIAMRQNHDNDTIDLFADDTAIAAEILGTPATVLPTDNQNNFDLAA